MKKFDKGYVHYHLLTDFFISIGFSLWLFVGFFLPEEGGIEKGNFLWALLVFVLLYCAFTAYRLLYVKTSGYELLEREIRCKRGVLFRKQSVLEYPNIHAINKKQNLIHRLFGIAVLTVDSGSTSASSSEEIIIVEKSGRVDELLGELQALREGKTWEKKEEESVLLSSEDSLYHFTSKRKWLYAFISFTTAAAITLCIGVILGAIMTGSYIFLAKDTPSLLVFYGAWWLLLTAGATLLLAVCTFIGFIIEGFVSYYHFRVAKKGNDIIISYGLLVRHTNTFSYDKMKAVKIKQGIIQRLLGFASIHLEVVGYVNPSTKGGEEGATIGVLVPFCKRKEVNAILEKILPEYLPQEKQTKSVALFPHLSWFTLIVGCVWALASGLALCSLLICRAKTATILGTELGIFAVCLVIFLIKLISAILCHKTSGLAFGKDTITTESGGWMKTITVLKTKHIVAVEGITTPLRKKAGITTLVLHVKTNAASNEVKVCIQKEEVLEQAKNLLTV